MNWLLSPQKLHVLNISLLPHYHTRRIFINLIHPVRYGLNILVSTEKSNQKYVNLKQQLKIQQFVHKHHLNLMQNIKSLYIQDLTSIGIQPSV